MLTIKFKKHSWSSRISVEQGKYVKNLSYYNAIHTFVYDERDDFWSPIPNFPLLSCDVYILQKDVFCSGHNLIFEKKNSTR